MSQLKEQDGRYYQECKVVMIATEKETNIIYRKNDDILIKKHTGNSALTETDKDFRNIYVTSNEEIKETVDLKNNYFYHIKSNEIFHCTKTAFPFIIVQEEKDNKNYFSAHIKDCKKIIATTDESLVINQGVYNDQNGKILERLPKPSDSFISKYIEEYNKGNIITNVLVEYEQCKVCQGTKRHIVSMFGEVDCNYCQKNEGYEKLYIEPKLKIDSNNTITIKKVKDSYSREEVINLLYKYNDGIIDRYSQLTNKDLDKWIKENL